MVIKECGTFTGASKQSKTTLHEANLLISKAVEDTFAILLTVCNEVAGTFRILVIQREKL